ncbi:MAG: hypothetical protein UX61_C0001G0027, partial [Parcubacteria group bacterium GW2011_GWA2_46_7]
MLRTSKKLILIVAVVVVAVIFIFVFNGSRQANGKDIVVEVSTDKSSYTAGEKVNIKLNLINSGSAGACLSESSIGNISFVSLTRDGTVVETRSAPSYFLTSFSQILKSRLITVAPGSVMKLSLMSGFDPGLDAEALSTTMPEDTSGIATFYNIEKPGQYELWLVYEYTGEPSDDCTDTIKGPTNV